MLLPKRCSRCRGDLYMGTDIWGPLIRCLQCGNILYDPETIRFSESAQMRQIINTLRRKRTKKARNLEIKHAT